MTNITEPTPEQLPFLQAICWDMADISHLTSDEMLDRYERGWAYRGVLGDIDGHEKRFLQTLAESRGSWLQGRI